MDLTTGNGLDMLDAFHLGAFLLLCVAVILSDLVVRKVFNAAVVAALVVQGGFLAVADAAGRGLAAELEPAMTGLLVGFVLMLPLYVFRAMGAGDVKFFAVLGWWLGPAALLPIFVVASVMAGVHALASSAEGSIWMVAVRDLGQRVVAVLPVPTAWRGGTGAGSSRQQRGIPYAAYMAVGAVGMLVWQS